MSSDSHGSPPGAPRSPSRGDQHALHVLLIDDEVMLLDVARQMLEHLGYRVTALRDPNEAVERFREAAPEFDALVVDRIMPTVSGEDVVRECRRVRADIPAVLISGDHPGGNLTSDLARSVICLEKPFSFESLHESVEAAMVLMG